MLHDAVGGVEARDGGGCDEDDGDRELQPHRLRESDDELADREGERRGDDADQDRAGNSSAGAVSPPPFWLMPLLLDSSPP